MVRWWEKVCPGCISETVRCRKFILGRDISLGGVGVQCHGLTLIDLAAVTLTLKILSGLYLGNHEM